jgi:hypothetical protein
MVRCVLCWPWCSGGVRFLHSNEGNVYCLSMSPQVHAERGHGAFVLHPDMQDSIITSLGGLSAAQHAEAAAATARASLQADVQKLHTRRPWATMFRHALNHKVLQVSSVSPATIPIRCAIGVPTAGAPMGSGITRQLRFQRRPVLANSGSASGTGVVVSGSMYVHHDATTKSGTRGGGYCVTVDAPNVGAPLHARDHFRRLSAPGSLQSDVSYPGAGIGGDTVASRHQGPPGGLLGQVSAGGIRRAAEYATRALRHSLLPIPSTRTPSRAAPGTSVRAGARVLSLWRRW